MGLQPDPLKEQVSLEALGKELRETTLSGTSGPKAPLEKISNRFLTRRLEGSPQDNSQIFWEEGTGLELQD